MLNEQELRLKRKVQAIVIAAMSLFFVLVTVVVFQFAIRINQENARKSLARENETLARQIELAKNDAAYFDSEQFWRDYALRYLNSGRPGDIINR